MNPSTDPAATDRDAPLDRTITPVAGNIGAARFGRAAAVTVLAVICGVLVLAPWKRRGEPETEKAAAPRQTVAFEPARPTLENPGPDAPTLYDEHADVYAAELAGQGATPERADTAPRPTPRHAPVLAWSASGRLGAAQAGAGPSGGGIGEEIVEAAPVGDAFDRLRRASSITTARARRLGDRNLLLSAGASIPCTLQTAMDSSLPGQVVCLVGRDVWSDNGAVVLLEKGARVLGEYRQGLRTGEGRLFVLWVRATTPSGVAIQLASPAADALGRAGFGGEVDRHFWRRFGGAVLLSVVDDAAVAAVGRQGDRDMARLPSDAAGIALDRSIDLPPTLRKPQGSQVTIMVAQDLDFSDVYGLSAAEGR